MHASRTFREPRHAGTANPELISHTYRINRAISAFLLSRPCRNPEIVAYLAPTAHHTPHTPAHRAPTCHTQPATLNPSNPPHTAHSNPQPYRLLKNRSSWDSRTLSPARNVAAIAPANPVAGIRQAAMKMFIQPSVDMRQQ